MAVATLAVGLGKPRLAPVAGILLALAAAAHLNGCAPAPPGPELYEFSGRIMGTGYDVKVVDLPRNLDAQTLRGDIRGILERIDRRMSTYREDSDLSRFNTLRATAWVDASPDLVRVLQAAQTASEMTAGAFDVTVGPLVNLWGFGPEPGGDEVPDEEAVQAGLKQVGYRHLHVRSTPPSIRKDRPDLYVDLSAIAKGFAVDQVAEGLEARGLNDYLVEVGGEVRGKGRNAEGTPWRIAVERPVPGQRAVYSIVALRDASIATSGNYRNYFVRDGRRYSHSIDPRTGRPVRHHLASVSVITPSAMQADALATGLLVLGPEAGYELAVRRGLAAFFILGTSTGFTHRATPAFSRYLSAGTGDS